jgi:hypothetical protein
MKKIIVFFLAVAALASCREWDPVLTLNYPEPPAREPLMASVNTSIAALKQRYLDNGNKPVEIRDQVVIGGQVISSDRSGNIYRDLYIQDNSGAICIKLGKSSLYSDYHLGQWVFVDCKGLTVGAYNGMPQLGIEDETGANETAYIDAQYLIDTHVFRGREAALPEPRAVTAAELEQALKDGGFKSRLWGAYVMLPGLTYGNQIFALLYPDGNSSIQLRDKSYGVTTWAMSKSKLLENIAAGKFDEKLSDETRASLIQNASPVTVSQYYSLGGTNVQIRTSGYSRFADAEIPVSGAIDVTGILTIYRTDAQFTLIDLDGVTVVNP